MVAQASFQLLRNKISATVFAKLVKLNLKMELVCPPKGNYKLQLHVQDLQRKHQQQAMRVFVLMVMLLPLTARAQPQMISFGVKLNVMIPHLHIALILTRAHVNQATLARHLMEQALSVIVVMKHQLTGLQMAVLVLANLDIKTTS